MVSIDTAASAEQPVVTNQVPNPVTTNSNVNATNHFVADTSTNWGASGCPIHHEWLWFRLEGHSGCSPNGISVSYSHCTSGTKSNAPSDPVAELL